MTTMLRIALIPSPRKATNPEISFCVLPQAERIFSEVRRIESYRVEGMEIYSTTLWHLQKDVALSALSKDLTDMDKNSPEVTSVLEIGSSSAA